ncbi:hypothetical protein R6Q57_010443 [Mikania cordata]
MEQKRIFCDQKLPPLSSRHQWFIAQDLESDTHIFYTIDNQQYHYQCRINELRGRLIRACFHGWMILSNRPDNALWFLWNPLTSKLIRLPPLFRKEEHLHECCLSAPPDAQGSVLLLITHSLPTIVFCRLDRKRKKLKWTEMSYAKQLKSIGGTNDCLLDSPTCCNGKVYVMAWLHHDPCVLLVDIVVKGKEVVIKLFVQTPHHSYNHCHFYKGIAVSHTILKGSCTELFYIVVGIEDETRKTVNAVHLFTLDMTSMKWEKMVDIKDATFFLDLAGDQEYSSCYYSSVMHSELEGYVHILGESGKIIYSFNPKDGTMSVSSMPRVVLESQASRCAMLEWRLDTDHGESKQEGDYKDTQIVVKPVKCGNNDFDCFIGESRLLNMPIHILQMIMELCIGIEYIRFRATCKLCRLAAPPIQCNSKTTLRRLQMYSFVSPWLMVLDNDLDIITFIDPIHNERYFIRTPQELNGDYQIFYSSFPTFCGRVVYALCNNERVDSFRDMTEADNYSWESVVGKAPRNRCKSPAQYYLSSCDQHILLVIVGEFGESVEVFEVNESTYEWEKIDGLGKHMIYISDTSCICLEAKSPEMGNKIYFPRLSYDNGMKIVFYSLETSRYHIFDDKNFQKSLGQDLLRTKYQCYSHTWIEPSWS